MLLYQAPTGYRSNSDSIFLAYYTATFRPRGRLLDVGAGSGVISLLLAREFPVEVSLSEKQPEVLEYARYNFAIHGHRIEAVPGDFLEVQWDRPFDFIVSNPPFYDPRVSQSDDPRINASRYAQHLPMEGMIEKVRRILKPRGRFLFCYDAKQSDRALELLRQAGLQPERVRFVHPKIDREAKIVLVAARSQSRSMCRIDPPWVIFDEENRYRPEAQRAMEWASTHFVSAEMDPRQ